MEFPEEYPITGNAFATMIHWRNPKFKAHKHIGLAKSAFGTHYYSKMNYQTMEWGGDQFQHPMALYELAKNDEGSVWKLHTVIKQGSTKADYPELWPRAERDNA